MIGQIKLKNSLLELYNTNKLPRVIILEGERGYGKKELLKWFSENTNIPYKLINKEDNANIDINKIREAIKYSQNDFNKIIYAFEDIEQSKNRNVQNTLLKFLEEPANNLMIFILCQDKNLLLPTIINRCTLFTLEKYTKDELKNFNEDQKALNIFNNPQDLIKAKTADIDNLQNSTNKIVESLDQANLANALKLNSYIKLTKDDEGLFDIDLFIKCLQYSFYQKYKEMKDESIRRRFNCLQTALKQLKSNSKYFMDSFILNNYIEAKGWNGKN